MKTTPFHTAAAAALLCAGSALAGPSQGTIDVPGGFATACASEVSAGGTYIPGRELLTMAGRSSCQSQTFTGAAGTAAAAASWSTPNVQNESSITARMGSIGFQATNASPRNVLFPVAVAGGGWSETMTIDVAGHTGESAIWTFRVSVEGTLAASNNGATTVDMNAYKNKEELWRSVPGHDRGNSDPLGTDRQRVTWVAGGNEQRSIADEVVFAVPVTLGQSFVWGVYGIVRATTASFNAQTTLTTAAADFSHTLRYGGTEALMLGGVAVDGYTFTSGSGIDWVAASPVPEPGTWAMFAAGLAALAGLARRRARAAA